MARIFYSAVFYLLIPFICLRLYWRGRRVPGYRQRWLQRFGFVPPTAAKGPVIWVHAVSVGETIAAVPLIKRLQAEYESATLVVTTTTPTGSDRVRAMLGDAVYHVFGPYDLPGSVRRFLGKIKPNILIIMETELWPNLIAECDRRAVPVIVANARLSAKSAKGYRRFGGLIRPMLQNITLVAAQYQDDADRFVSLGLPRENLLISGNIKFDLELNDSQRAEASALRQQWLAGQERLVWLVASTHQGEEEVVLSAFRELKKIHQSLLLVLVPRHPDRFDQVAQLCIDQGFSICRKSLAEIPQEDIEIVLGDTMGELPLFFGASDIAFVGGSLVSVGGHNLMEPAAWGVPILSGPHLFNFSEASKLLIAADALHLASNASELALEVDSLLRDSSLRAQRGAAALHVVEENRGAMERLLAAITLQLSR